MPKVNTKDTRTPIMTLLFCFYCHLGTYFTSSSRVSVIDFKQDNICWVTTPQGSLQWKIGE